MIDIEEEILNEVQSQFSLILDKQIKNYMEADPSKVAVQGIINICK